MTEFNIEINITFRDIGDFKKFKESFETEILLGKLASHSLKENGDFRMSTDIQ